MKLLNSEKRRPRGEHWLELIARQEQSGMTVHAFCSQHGVTEASFYGWRKRLRDNTPVSFALVGPSNSEHRPAPVEFVLATGERVRVAPGTDAATLRMVLAVLREHA